MDIAVHQSSLDLWDVETGVRSELNVKLPYSAAFSDDGNSIVIGDCDDGIRVLTVDDLDKQSEVHKQVFEGVSPGFAMRMPVIDVGFSRDGSRFFSADFGNHAVVWRTGLAEQVGAHAHYTGDSGWRVCRCDSSLEVPLSLCFCGVSVWRWGCCYLTPEREKSLAESMAPVLPQHRSRWMKPSSQWERHRVLFNCGQSTVKRILKQPTRMLQHPTTQAIVETSLFSYAEWSRRVTMASFSSPRSPLSMRIRWDCSSPNTSRWPGSLRERSPILAIEFSADRQRIVAASRRWLHAYQWDGKFLRYETSRYLRGDFPDGENIHFGQGSHVRFAVKPTDDSVSLVTINLDQPEAQPMEGDPEILFAEFEQKVRLTINEQVHVVPLR